MPTAYIKKLAEQGKGTIAELEGKWEEAKAQAAKSGHAEDFAYVTSIFKKMAHIKGSAMKINAAARLAAFAPQGRLSQTQPGMLQVPVMTTSAEDKEDQKDDKDTEADEPESKTEFDEETEADEVDPDLTPDEFVDEGEGLDDYYEDRQVEAGENAYLKKLVDSGQFTQEQVDDAWAKAMDISDKNAKENPDIVPSYAYTTAIFQDLLGIKDRDPSSPAQASITKPFGVAAAARLKIMASQEVDFDMVENEAKVKAMLKGIGCRVKSKVFYEDDGGNPRSISGEYKIEPMDIDELVDSVDTYFYDARLKGKTGKKCWWEIEGDGGIMLELEYDSSGKINFNVTEP